VQRRAAIERARCSSQLRERTPGRCPRRAWAPRSCRASAPRDRQVRSPRPPAPLLAAAQPRRPARTRDAPA